MANIVSVNYAKNKQFFVTIPKAIAGAMRLEHKSKIEFVFVNGEIVLRKI